jgi:hypothetical protein
MPYGGTPLSKGEIDTISHWIDAGAPGPDSSEPIQVSATPTNRHWAFVKPVRPMVPSVHNASWPKNPIDNFILARMEKEGLKPSPEADRTTLLRRVYLDLIGLPPSPKDVDDFLADKSADAYDKVVDRLLASPRYGERWARPWLDLARYADSNGYEKDSRRNAWEYRDWVIRALNSDMSFREFTIEQIAGDLLPHATDNQLVATGFNRNSMLNQEGGVDPEEYYWLAEVDRANTTASVWLGVTLGCAQCHNHKFDPFTQKNYYRFLAFFNNEQYTVRGVYADEPQIELPTAEQKAKSDDLRARMADLREKLNRQTPELEEAQRSWESRLRAAESDWKALQIGKLHSEGGATMTLQPDRSIMAGGKNPEADTYVIEARTDAAQIRGLRIEVLPDASLPKGGPGRDPEGNFFLSALEVQAAPANSSSQWQRVVWKEAQADESQGGYGVQNLVPPKVRPGRKAVVNVELIGGWAIQADENTQIRRQAVLVPDRPFGFAGGTQLRVTLRHNMRHSSRNVGRFRLSATSAADPKFIVQVPARLRPVLEMPADRRTDDQKRKLSAAYRTVSPLLDTTRKEVATLETQISKLGIATALVMKDRDPMVRPAAFIRERGTFLNKGEEVKADVPEILNPLPEGEVKNRLAMARWLVSDDNPLTARVTVNRYWETMFGHGIVETSEDFGTQGEAPTHPELLDWLATEFMRDGWDMKQIKRLMVTSATYRQSSRVTSELEAKDPYNRLYARGPRFRVEAEEVHDMALAASGLLSDKMFGPSVFPYQPDGIWDIPYSDEKWIESQNEDRYRRSIYTFVRRSAPYPSLMTYDAPSREFCTVRRVRTNTPLQALTSLNDPFFFNAARAMGKRMLVEGGSTEQARISYGFKLAVSREPSAMERDRLVKFYREQRAGGVPESTAWALVANVLMNLDEAITKE